MVYTVALINAVGVICIQTAAAQSSFCLRLLNNQFFGWDLKNSDCTSLTDVAAVADDDDAELIQNEEGGGME